MDVAPRKKKKSFETKVKVRIREIKNSDGSVNTFVAGGHDSFQELKG